jgi:hypothetical protein
MNDNWKYVPVPAEAVPQGIVWVVPQRNQGQIVEVAYSRGNRRRQERQLRR